MSTQPPHAVATARGRARPRAPGKPLPRSPSIEFHSLVEGPGTPVPTPPLTGPRELGG